MVKMTVTTEKSKMEGTYIQEPAYRGCDTLGKFLDCDRVVG